MFAAPLPRCVAHRQDKKAEFEKHNQTSSPFQEKTRNYLTGVPDCRTSPPPWRLRGEGKSRRDHYPHGPCIYNRCRAITSTISRARSLDQNYRKRITNQRGGRQTEPDAQTDPSVGTDDGIDARRVYERKAPGPAKRTPPVRGGRRDVRAKWPPRQSPVGSLV